MGYDPHQGAALLIPFNNVPHLFSVMNDACENHSCLLIMISSIKSNKAHDPTCILRPGDHDFIRHESFLVYRLAREVHKAHLAKMVDQRLYFEKNDFREDVFRRIAAGIFDSDETRGVVRKYANNVG